jgi:hypothetical protein
MIHTVTVIITFLIFAIFHTIYTLTINIIKNIADKIISMIDPMVRISLVEYSLNMKIKTELKIKADSVII